MAIRAITGVPGAGKTYYAVEHICKNHCEFDVKKRIFKLKNDITIFTNIDDLLLPHKQLNEAIEHYKGLSEFFNKEVQESLTNKYGKILYIIDEAQGLFNRKLYNDKIFFYFQYHRHLGHDIYLITHNLNLIPKELKELIEIEIRAVPRSLSLTGELKYLKLINQQIVDRSSVRLKPKIYELYKSATAKEVENVRNPFMKYIYALGVFMVFAGVFFYNGFYKKFVKHEGSQNIATVQEQQKQKDLKSLLPGKTIIPTISENFEKVRLSYIRLDDHVYIVFNENIYPLENFPHKVLIENKMGLSFYAFVPIQKKEGERRSQAGSAGESPDRDI